MHWGMTRIACWDCYWLRCVPHEPGQPPYLKRPNDDSRASLEACVRCLLWAETKEPARIEDYPSVCADCFSDAMCFGRPCEKHRLHGTNAYGFWIDDGIAWESTPHMGQQYSVPIVMGPADANSPGVVVPEEFSTLMNRAPSMEEICRFFNVPESKCTPLPRATFGFLDAGLLDEISKSAETTYSTYEKESEHVNENRTWNVVIKTASGGTDKTQVIAAYCDVGSEGELYFWHWEKASEWNQTTDEVFAEGTWISARAEKSGTAK